MPPKAAWPTASRFITLPRRNLAGKPLSKQGSIPQSAQTRRSASIKLRSPAQPPLLPIQHRSRPGPPPLDRAVAAKSPLVGSARVARIPAAAAQGQQHNTSKENPRAPCESALSIRLHSRLSFLCFFARRAFRQGKARPMRWRIRCIFATDHVCQCNSTSSGAILFCRLHFHGNSHKSALSAICPLTALRTSP